LVARGGVILLRPDRDRAAGFGVRLGILLTSKEMLIGDC
jgi:hypothetical protein